MAAARLAARGHIQHLVEVLVEAALEDARLLPRLVLAQALGRRRHVPRRRQVVLTCSKGAPQLCWILVAGSFSKSVWTHRTGVLAVFAWGGTDARVHEHKMMA